MLVKNWMSRPVVTISPTASMQMARDMMDRNNIRALPVVEKESLVGLLTDRDLKRAEASDATSLDTHELKYLLQKVQVAKIMTPNPVTLSFDATLSEAAELFLENKAEAAPVMAGGDQLVGVLTRTDLERAILKLTSFGRRGVQFGIRVTDTPGAVMDVVAIVRDARARLASLITSDASESPGSRDAFVHIYNVNRRESCYIWSISKPTSGNYSTVKGGFS
jgi:acetoin utilization protein AcuB